MDTPLDELAINGFPLGLDTTSKDGALGPQGARRLLGMTPDYEGGLRHAGNFRQIVPLAYHAIAFIRWSFGTADRLLFVTSDIAGRQLIYVWNETTGLLDRTILVSSFVPPTTTMNNRARFVQAGLDGGVFLLLGRSVSGVDDVSHLYHITDPLTDTMASDISIPVETTTGYPDSQAVVTVADGAGDLNSTGYSRYQHSVQLIDSTGRMSQISLPSPPTELVNEWARISFGGIPPVDLVAAITAGRIVSANLYRIGGKATQLRLVKNYQLAVVGGQIVDAITGAEIRDTTSEEDLSFIFAPTYNDPAPTGLVDIILHQNKLFGIGDGVHFSRTNDFLYFGYDDNGVDDDGGVIYPDNNTGDKYNGLASEGSLLVIGREETVYTLYGNSLGDSGGQGFAFDKRANFGNCGRHSICRSDNDTFFVGRDDLLHAIRDINSPSVSARVQRTLKSLQDKDVIAVVTGHFNGQIYCSFPYILSGSIDGTCLVYDTQKGIWRDATDSRLLSNYLGTYPSPTNGELELLSAARGGGIFACETYNNGTSGTERSIDIESDKLLFPPERVGRFSAILIEGTMVNSISSPMQATLTAGMVTKTYPLVQSGDNLLYYVSLPPDLTGKFIQVRLTGKLLAGEIRRISIGTLDIRRAS